MAGVDKQAPGPNPGFLFVNSKINKKDELPEEEYTRWYEKRHIPDIFETSGISEAARWKSPDPAADRPFLALYPLEDLDFLKSAEFKAIPVHDDSLPGSGAIFDLADFDTRYYKWVQTYEPEGKDLLKDSQPDWVIAAQFTPADDEDYDNWYKQEHLKDVSKITGWRGTKRFVWTFNRHNRDPALPKQGECPKFLTLHYFDGEKLPEDELAKAGESEWTKKNMSTMKVQAVGVFQKLSLHRK